MKLIYRTYLYFWRRGGKLEKRESTAPCLPKDCDVSMVFVLIGE